MEKAEVISFAGGVPEPELLPIAGIAKATARVLETQAADSLQYSVTDGYLPLRDFLAARLQKRGVEVSAENILITNGSQQGLDLVAKVFIDDGDLVITERPTYLGMIQAFSAYNTKFLSLDIDQNGLRIELLEEALRKQVPRLLYVLPNFQNPAGVTLSLERRRRIVELAEQYGFPILEDDPYGELRYSGEHLPPIASMAKDNVILLGTISKTITPGHRLGWVVAPLPVIQKVNLAKQAADLHSNTFSQRVIYEYCRQGLLDDHLKFLCQRYGAKRKAMLSALEKYFPAEVKWTKPEGGLFLWVTLPEGMSSVGLLKKAIPEGVAFVPGSDFFPDRSNDNTLRLSYSTATIEQIDLGIKRLAAVLKRELAK